MGETLGVDIVDGLDQLLGVVAHDALLERARVCHVVEELATVDQLADNVGDLHLLAILLVPRRTLVELEVLDDVLVVQRLDRLHLIAQQLEGALVELWVIQSENLDGKLGTLRVRAQLDLRAEAAAKGASKSVLSYCRSHISFCLNVFVW